MCLPSSDEVGESLKFKCLQWATAGSAKEPSEVREEEKDRNSVWPREWLETISFQSNASTVHADRANTVVHPFRAKLVRTCE